MHWDRQWIAEPERPCDQEPDVETEKAQRYIRPHRASDDETAHAGDEKAEPSDLSPLSGRDPAQSARYEEDQRQIRRVEDVLLLPADDELAGDGNDCRQRGNGQFIGAEKKTEAQGRHERAQRIERRQLTEARSGILGEQRGTERGGNLGNRDIEVQPEQPIQQQRAEAGDLIKAGIEGRELSLQRLNETMSLHPAPRG